MNDGSRRIAALRRSAGMTQADLAEKLSLSRSSVTNIESGYQKITLAVAVAAADIFGISVSDILGENADSDPLPWLDLAKRVTADERAYSALADAAWRDHDYLKAIRYRGVAEGLDIARTHHAVVIAANRQLAEDSGS